MTLVAVEWITLDGVMQSPARADEDPRGGFTHGGWSVPYGDQIMASIMNERMTRPARGGGGILLGRRTYADFAGVWPLRAGDPMADRLTASQKYVVSRSLREPLQWDNSAVLTDAEGQVAELKQERDLTILGSGTLVRSLMSTGLIDELLLSICPIVLGEGQRLFPEHGPSAALTLVDATPTTTGVLIATYRPVR